MSNSLSAPLRTICILVTCTFSTLLSAQTVPVFRITDLGSLADSPNDEGISVALGINLLNEIVGQTEITQQANNAFVWLPVDNYPGFTVGTLLPKYTMLDLGSGVNSLRDVANDISNHGKIAGMAADGMTANLARVWNLTNGVTSTLFSRSFRIGPSSGSGDITGWSINDNLPYDVAGWDNNTSRGGFVWKSTDSVNLLTYLPSSATFPYRETTATFGVNSVFPSGDTTKTGHSHHETKSLICGDVIPVQWLGLPANAGDLDYPFTSSSPIGEGQGRDVNDILSPPPGVLNVAEIAGWVKMPTDPVTISCWERASYWQDSAANWYELSDEILTTGGTPSSDSDRAEALNNRQLDPCGVDLLQVVGWVLSDNANPQISVPACCGNSEMVSGHDTT